MSDVQVLEIFFDAFSVVTTVAGPMLAAALIIGVGVSVIQTVTQVQEMTLSFVPKLVAMGAILVFGGNWMIRELVSWVTGLWTQIGGM